MVARAVEAMEEDYWVLDPILNLVVTFIPPAALPLVLALPAPWQLPAAQPQAALGLN